MKSLHIISAALLWTACNINDFEGSPKTQAPKADIPVEEVLPKQVIPAAAQDDKVEANLPKAGSLATDTPIESVETILIATEPVLKAECSEILNYNPSEILCNIQQSSTRTVWNVVGEWDARVKLIANPAAYWISPLATVKSGPVGQEISSCPFLVNSDKLIFVSNFKLEENQKIKLEAIIDNLGQVRLWKNADPSQEVFISSKSEFVQTSMMLEKGFYSIVIDGIDTTGGATGSIASVFDQSGNIIRQTEAKDDWCIFRVSAETDVPSFLQSASSCRSCLIGTEAAGTLPR